MSQQTVNVSIVPGPLTWSGPRHREDGISAVTFRGVTITDQRGGISGWTARGVFPRAQKVIANMSHVTPGSAPGVNFVSEPTLYIDKDESLGPAGSSGGQYEFDITVFLPMGEDATQYEFPGLTLEEGRNV